MMWLLLVVGLVVGWVLALLFSKDRQDYRRTVRDRDFFKSAYRGAASDREYWQDRYKSEAARYAYAIQDGAKARERLLKVEKYLAKELRRRR
jgi:hypothetical protein